MGEKIYLLTTESVNPKYIGTGYVNNDQIIINIIQSKKPMAFFQEVDNVISDVPDISDIISNNKDISLIRDNDYQAKGEEGKLLNQLRAKKINYQYLPRNEWPEAETEILPTLVETINSNETVLSDFNSIAQYLQVMNELEKIGMKKESWVNQHKVINDISTHNDVVNQVYNPDNYNSANGSYFPSREKALERLTEESAAINRLPANLRTHAVVKYKNNIDSHIRYLAKLNAPKTSVTKTAKLNAPKIVNPTTSNLGNSLLSQLGFAPEQPSKPTITQKNVQPSSPKRISPLITPEEVFYSINKIPANEYRPINTDKVTPEDVLNILEDEKKLEAIRKNLLSINKWKNARYIEIQNHLIYQRDDIDAKTNAMGITGKEVNEVFPQYKGIIVAIMHIESILKKLAEHHKQYAHEDSIHTIKHNFTSAITNKRRGLAVLKGEVRDNVRNLIADQLYSLTRSSEVFIDNFRNMVIMGSAGTGKTLVASIISYVFSTCGILATDNIVVATRADLVGQYIGETAIKTRSQLFNTLEGVLFIDEAYQLYVPDSTKDYGAEAITEIVNFLDKYIGLTHVIAAGYKDQTVKNFLGANEGMPRRFPYQIVLSNYSLHDLYEILMTNLNRRFPDKFGREDVNFIYALLKYLNEQNVFNNQAGDMTNLASFITTRVSSGKIPWGKSGNENRLILAFNSFLESKGSDFRINLNE